MSILLIVAESIRVAKLEIEELGSALAHSGYSDDKPVFPLHFKPTRLLAIG